MAKKTVEQKIRAPFVAFMGATLSDAQRRLDDRDEDILLYPNTELLESNGDLEDGDIVGLFEFKGFQRVKTGVQLEEVK